MVSLSNHVAIPSPWQGRLPTCVQPHRDCHPRIKYGVAMTSPNTPPRGQFAYGPLHLISRRPRIPHLRRNQVKPAVSGFKGFQIQTAVRLEIPEAGLSKHRGKLAVCIEPH